MYCIENHIPTDIHIHSNHYLGEITGLLNFMAYVLAKITENKLGIIMFSETKWSYIKKIFLSKICLYL